MTPQEAYNNLYSAITQALGNGLFKEFENVAIAQQSLMTIKNYIEQPPEIKPRPKKEKEIPNDEIKS
jgi:hypothetical protein